MKFFSKLQKFDWILFSASVLLVIFGLISIYSSADKDYSNFYKQLIFFVISILAMLGMSFLDNRILRENSLLLLLIYLFV